MRVEIELHLRIPVNHVADTGIHLIRTQHPQGIRQQETVDPTLLYPVHQTEYVFRFIAIAVGPVFQVHIDLQALVPGVADGFPDVRNMLFQGFIELGTAVFLAALGQQVHGPAAGLDDPVNAALVVDKAQHLNALQVALAGRPLVDGGNGRLLAFRYLRGSHLNPINSQPFQ